jgi:hypothetical protein
MRRRRGCLIFRLRRGRVVDTARWRVESWASVHHRRSSSSVHRRRSASEGRAVSASRVTKRRTTGVGSAALERPVDRGFTAASETASSSSSGGGGDNKMLDQGGLPRTSQKQEVRVDGFFHVNTVRAVRANESSGRESSVSPTLVKDTMMSSILSFVSPPVHREPKGP